MFEVDTRRTLFRDSGGEGIYSRMSIAGVDIVKRKDKTIFECWIGEDNKIVNELKTRTVKEKGGIIVFSIDENINPGAGYWIRLEIWVRNKAWLTINQIRTNSKIDSIIGKNQNIKEAGFSIGNYFIGGCYRAKRGEIFDEKSATLEITGISSEILEKVASQIAREFHQDSVLVKDFETNDIYFVDSTGVQTIEDKINTTE